MLAVIGAIIGSMVFGAIHVLLLPVGIIIGAAAGRSFSQGFISIQRPLSNEEKKAVEQAFFNTLFPIMGQIAKADGRICEKEIEATQVLFEKMGLNTEARRVVIDLFKSGAEDDFDFNATLANFVNQSNINLNLKKIFLVYLISVAFADGYLHDAEDRILKTVAQRLGFSVFAYQQLLGMIEAQRYFYRGQQEGAYHYRDSSGARRPPGKDELTLAYEALGVSPSVTDKELKLAWRKLMSENHPDKLAGSGVPEDMVKLATERSQEIQSAYDLIKKHRK